MNPLGVVINDLDINSLSGGITLDTQIEGLGLPEIRTSSGVNSGADGGYVSAQYYGHRYVSLQGRAFASDTSALFDLRTALQTALAGLSVELRITTYAGQAYIIYGNVTRFEMPIEGVVNRALFRLELLAADPTIYDDATGAFLTANLNRYAEGGFTWPITWPITWPAATGVTTVVNSGSVFIRPTITLTGSMTSPVITNTTTGQLFSMSTLTTTGSDVVEIDLRARTVTLNGGNIYPYVDGLSSWWGLAVGNNDLKLSTSNGSDTVTGTVSWRNGVMGI